MEYKICENCNEKLHVRTQRCPVCNTVLTEKSQVVQEVEEMQEAQEIPKEESVEQNSVKDDIEMHETEKFDSVPRFEAEVGSTDLPDKELRDYVYKAEVRHSLEYTKLMPNSLKVFITAISMIPIVGQIIGTFFGVFFLTYEDSDRKSFGRSLIGLAIIMFVFYAYNVALFSEMVESGGLTSVIENM